MFRVLFLLFILVPIIEIALLIQVSEVIGGVATIALVILTALLGARLVKQQGIAAVTQAQSQMAQGQMPAKQLFAGVCIVIAGVMLLTPGIITDIFGFLLLTPVVRDKMAATFSSQAHVRMNQQGFSAQSSFYEQQNAPSHTPNEPHQPTVIEGEYKTKE